MENVETWQYFVIAGPAFVLGMAVVFFLHREAITALEQMHADEIEDLHRAHYSDKILAEQAHRQEIQMMLSAGSSQDEHTRIIAERLMGGRQ